MFKYIEKLRSHSESKRKNISLAISLAITLFIFIIWGFIALNSQDSNGEAIPASGEVEMTPFSGISEDLSRVLNQMKNSF